jgi:hypothetical protein
LTRLIDLFRDGQLSLSEYQTYLDLGFQPSESVQLNSGRSAELVTLSYMNLGSGRSWTVKSGETLMGYIGPSSNLENNGTITNAGDILFQYSSEKGIENTGTIENSGYITLQPI